MATDQPVVSRLRYPTSFRRAWSCWLKPLVTSAKWPRQMRHLRAEEHIVMLTAQPVCKRNSLLAREAASLPEFYRRG